MRASIRIHPKLALELALKVRAEPLGFGGVQLLTRSHDQIANAARVEAEVFFKGKLRLVRDALRIRVVPCPPTRLQLRFEKPPKRATVSIFRQLVDVTR